MQMQEASIAPSNTGVIQTAAAPAETTAARHQVLSPTLSDRARLKFWNACKMPCRVITTLVFDLKSYGCHHVPERGGALLISNHQSVLDPVMLGVHLRRPISFIAKSELFENPKFSWLIRNLNAFAVRRGQPDVAAIKEALHRVKDGQVVTLFPEGTRSK